MSKELEALDGLFDLVTCQGSFEQAQKYYNTLEESILKAQEQEKENAEYKKILNIIKEKKVDIYILNDLGTLEEYNEWVLKKYGTYYQLTQEEFTLLKRWIENEYKI